jgi:hypothetical protein
MYCKARHKTGTGSQESPRYSKSLVVGLPASWAWKKARAPAHRSPNCFHKRYKTLLRTLLAHHTCHRSATSLLSDSCLPHTHSLSEGACLSIWIRVEPCWLLVVGKVNINFPSCTSKIWSSKTGVKAAGCGPCMCKQKYLPWQCDVTKFSE